MRGPSVPGEVSIDSLELAQMFLVPCDESFRRKDRPHRPLGSNESNDDGRAGQA